MPTITVNGAELYYETYGTPRPGQAPVVLIHGATGTGQSTWGGMAPRLGQQYFVIVPDCRGHGRSANPTHSYSFRELADDTAALIRALGFEKVHLVGHSNGGNVALVTLVEHPEVIKTAVIQAANAYVSQDLVEREPAIFDPENVRRDNPEWMERMIAQHGPTHGPDYWRELLHLTLVETIREPNYTPEDLARVQRPTLVIQGAQDPVNAPAHHAEFIAQHIPNAELWLPEGVEHTVHAELPDEWLERVQDFWQRRGADRSLGFALVNRAVTDLRREPRMLAERVSQALLGEAVHILDDQGEWAYVRLEHDGYEGWLQTAALHPCAPDSGQAYQAECNAKVQVPILDAYTTVPPLVAGKLPFATPVIVEAWIGERAQVRLPDGRGWDVPAAALLAAADLPRRDADGVAFTLDLLRPMVGTPYLWGGRTPFGYDCSGLAQAFLGFLGIQVRRDAQQQFEQGQPVEGATQPGDLLFFGEGGGLGESPQVTHVAIALGNDEILHANGTTWSIAYNSLDPTRRNYRAWLAEHWLGTRRYL